MAQFGRAALILCAALAAPVAGGADPSVPLTGFGDFSSARTQLGFDELGLVPGDDVAGVGGATFSLTSSGAPKYYEDVFARESGIEGVGSLSNFWGMARPYADVAVAFSGRMHRVGFEARVNDADELAVSLLSGGVLVEQMRVASRGSDQLYFYGYENLTGFDQVVVDVIANASGAYTLDNFTFESVSTTPPDDPEDPGDPEDPEDPEDPGDPGDPELAMLACDGFESFPPAHRGRHIWPVRALLAELHDADGLAMTSLEVSPKLRVLFTPHAGGPAVDVSDSVLWRGPDFAFLPGRLQRWFIWLLPWQMQKEGTYMATMESGDPALYTVDPTCADWTVNAPRPQPPHSERDCKDRRNHRHHGHDRRGH